MCPLHTNAARRRMLLLLPLTESAWTRWCRPLPEWMRGILQSLQLSFYVSGLVRDDFTHPLCTIHSELAADFRLCTFPNITVNQHGNKNIYKQALTHLHCFSLRGVRTPLSSAFLEKLVCLPDVHWNTLNMWRFLRFTLIRHNNCRYNVPCIYIYIQYETSYDTIHFTLQ